MYGVLADAYARKENYSQAIRYGEEALRIKTIIYPNGSLDLALTYNKLSFYYTASGDLDNATRCAEREHHIREQLEKSDLKKDYQFSIANKEIEDKCNELHSLSWSYFEKNNYEKAIELGENILELWNKSSLPHNREYTNYVNFLSLYYAANNELETAISTALSVKDFMESIDHEDPDYLAYVSSISRWYAELSNYSESELWARHALETINDINSVNYYDHALALNTLAKCNQQMGHYGEAIDHYLEVITILQNDTTSNLDLMSSSLYGLSCCYGSIAKYEDAIQYGELALKIRNKGKSLIPYANQLLEMSRYYKEIHNYQMALDYVDKASTIYKNEDNDSISYLIALRSKAWIYYELGDDSLAFTILEEAYDIGRTMLGDDAPRISSFVVDYAQTLILKHDYNKGIELLKNSLPIIESSKGKESKDYLITLEYLILALGITNQFDEIKPLLKEYLYLLQNYTILNFNNFSYENRYFFWEEINDALEKMFYIATCVQYKEDSDMEQIAYDISLFSKGVLLSSQLIIENTIRESHDVELNHKLSLLQKYKNLVLANNNRLDSLQERVDLLEREIVKRSSKIEHFKWPFEYKWQDIQNSLSNNEVAIEFYKSLSYYYALIIKKGWNSPKVICLFKNETIDLLSMKGHQLYNIDNSQYAYFLLFAQIQELLKPGDTVYFSPSGVIHQINLECLNDKSGNLLGEIYKFVRLSSTRELINKENYKSPHSAVLYGGLLYDVDTQEMLFQSQKYHNSFITSLFDNNEVDSLNRNGWRELPETKKEVNEIKLLLDSYKISNVIYTGSLGNEESFKNITNKKTSIIHLATHGFFLKDKNENSKVSDKTSLMRSGLLLSGAQKKWKGEIIPQNVDDGILFAEEISSLNLSGTDLVVLSACQTGLGWINNEGVWGLQRAFKLAGVKSILMSLWKVDDVSTKLFMVEFYKNYLSGKSKRESLISAQKYIREFKDVEGNKVFEDPSYWASFILLDGLK